MVGAHEESRDEEVSVGGMQDGLTHTDTNVELVECTPARKETRVGDGCAKWRKSRGRNKGASIRVEPSKPWRVCRANRKIPLVPIIGEKRMTR